MLFNSFLISLFHLFLLMYVSSSNDLNNYTMKILTRQIK